MDIEYIALDIKVERIEDWKEVPLVFLSFFLSFFAFAFVLVLVLVFVFVTFQD